MLLDIDDVRLRMIRLIIACCCEWLAFDRNEREMIKVRKKIDRKGKSV